MFSFKSTTVLVVTIVHLSCVEAIQFEKPHSQDLKKDEHKEQREGLESHLSSLIRTVDSVVTIVYDFNETAFTMMPQFAKHIDAVSNLVLLLKKAVGTYYATDQEAKPAVVSWGTSLVVKLNTTLGAANQNIRGAFGTLSAKSSVLIGKVRRNAGAVTDALTAAQEIADKARSGYNGPYDVDKKTADKDDIDTEDTASLLRARSIDKSVLSSDSQLDRSVEQKSADTKTPCSSAHHLVNTAHKDISDLSANILQLNTSLPSLVKAVMGVGDASLSKVLALISQESAATPDVIPDMILDAIKDVQSKVKDVPADLVKIAFSAMDTNDIDSKTSVVVEPIDKLLNYVTSMQQHTEVACKGVDQ